MKPTAFSHRWWWRRAAQHVAAYSHFQRSHSVSSAAACLPETTQSRYIKTIQVSIHTGTFSYRDDPHLRLVEVTTHSGGTRVARSFRVLLVVLQLEQQVLLLQTEIANRLLLDVLVHQVAFHLRGGRLIASNCGIAKHNISQQF